MTTGTPDICQTWENSLEPRGDDFNVLHAHLKWHVPDRKTPELALGLVTASTSIKQTSHIIDDRKGVEMGLQDCKVQTTDGYRHEGGDGGVAGIGATGLS